MPILADRKRRNVFLQVIFCGYVSRVERLKMEMCQHLIIIRGNKTIASSIFSHHIPFPPPPLLLFPLPSSYPHLPILSSTPPLSPFPPPPLLLGTLKVEPSNFNFKLCSWCTISNPSYCGKWPLPSEQSIHPPHFNWAWGRELDNVLSFKVFVLGTLQSYVIEF